MNSLSGAKYLWICPNLSVAWLFYAVLLLSGFSGACASRLSAAPVSKPKGGTITMSKSGLLMMMLALSVILPGHVQASNGSDVDVTAVCAGLPTHAQLQSALTYAR